MTDILDPVQPSAPVSTGTYSFPADYAALVGIWLLDANGNMMRKLDPKPIWEQGLTQTGDPWFYSPKGDGTFELYPTPITGSGLSVKIIYDADLTLIALDDIQHDAFIRKHRTCFIQGIFSKALQNKNDTRSDREIAKYENYVKLVVSRERMGTEFDGNVPLQMKVVDY